MNFIEFIEIIDQNNPVTFIHLMIYIIMFILMIYLGEKLFDTICMFACALIIGMMYLIMFNEKINGYFVINLGIIPLTFIWVFFDKLIFKSKY